MATDQPLTPPASSQVLAKQVLDLVGPVCDRWDVSKNPRVRERRGVLIKNGMAEALYIAARVVRADADADQLRWMADAILVTLPPARPDTGWREDLKNAAGLWCAGAVFLVAGLLLLFGPPAASSPNDAPPLGTMAVVAGVVCLGFGVLPVRRLWLARSDIWNGR